MFIILENEIDQQDEMSGFSASAHGGVITRKDFPHMEVLQKEFIDEIPNIFAQKVGLLQSS